MRANIEIIDANWLSVTFEHKECAYDMNKYFTHKLEDQFLANNYKHKFNRWDGTVKFYNMKKQIIYLGLLNKVMKYLANRKYDIIFGDKLKAYFSEVYRNEELKFDFEIYRPEEFGLRDYQRKAVVECLVNKRRLIQSPTASGKSFIIHNIVSHLRDEGKTSLVIVPSVTLVNQMGGDFEEYGMDSRDFHLICEGAEKYTDVPIVVSTWQSLQHILDDQKYFERFDCVIVDEAHEANSKTIVKLVLSCVNAYYRFGFSGTYYKPKTDIMTLVGLFGPKFVTATTRQLIDWGYLPELNIGIVILKYLEEDRRFVKGSKYPDEMEFIETHIHRNEIVSRIALTRTGNTLCLFRHVKHGELLRRLAMSQLEGSKSIYFLTGKDKDKVRREVKRIMEENNNCLVFASYGIFSKGVSIKNLRNVILGSDMKSHNKVAQSIGRALRQLAGKESVNVYDIFDDMSITKTLNGKRKLINPYENYAYAHGFDRVELYEREEFDCQITSKKLTKTYLDGIDEKEGTNYDNDT